MQESKQTVVFDKDTGKILRIGPGIDADNSIIVPLSEVIGLKDGTQNKLDYRVVFDIDKRQYTIQKRNRIISSTIQDLIYEIPETTETEITIIQDFKNNAWKILLDDSVRQTLLENGLNINQTLHFSITAPGDPNILYRYIMVQLNDLLAGNVDIQFTMPFESTQKPLSIFTRKVFNTYGRTYEF